VLAANPGERAGALREVASGGEAARILLALRGALAVRQSTPTLVFDEVDAGVGGRLGPQVGAKLAGLAQHHQIFCVTHLPAIAALADRHLRVEKDVDGGRTRTRVAHLSGQTRVEEIADMIAGGADQATALAEAQRLLNRG
ncbi:MAG: DNA repair protein RecN, partial [Planctomycetota bacterium]|nr:DNA repair protein RecN [Planctomycetota bacterium]